MVPSNGVCFMSWLQKVGSWSFSLQLSEAPREVVPQVFAMRGFQSTTLLQQCQKATGKEGDTDMCIYEEGNGPTRV